MVTSALRFIELISGDSGLFELPDAAISTSAIVTPLSKERVMSVLSPKAAGH